MAYVSGDLILDAHYNGFKDSVNAVWGAGSFAGATGYGQGTTLSAVAVGDTVSATQWSTLLARISSAASHQGTSITAITAPVAGDTISAYTALSGNITAITNGRYNATAVGTDITTGGVGQRTATWIASVTMTYTITFASADAARYFFNAGGTIRMTFSRSGGTAHTKNTTWTALCSAAGTVVMSNGYTNSTIAGTSYNAGATKIGGSGSATIATGTGYQDLTTSNQQIFLQYSPTAPYTANYIQVNVRGNTAAPSSQVIFDVVFKDDAADNSIPSSLDVVDGTLQTTLVLRPPSTTYISNTWGTPTISCSVSGS